MAGAWGHWWGAWEQLRGAMDQLQHCHRGPPILLSPHPNGGSGIPGDAGSGAARTSLRMEGNEPQGSLCLDLHLLMTED